MMRSKWYPLSWGPLMCGFDTSRPDDPEWRMLEHHEDMLRVQPGFKTELKGRVNPYNWVRDENYAVHQLYKPDYLV